MKNANTISILKTFENAIDIYRDVAKWRSNK